MKGRRQKIFDKAETCPQKNRTASEGYAGGQTFLWISENKIGRKLFYFPSTRLVGLYILKFMLYI